MKNYSIVRQAMTILTVAAILVIFVTRPSTAQENPKSDAKKTMKIKIIKEDNGRTTVIDTVFSTDTPLDTKEMLSVMQQAENEMKDAQKQRKQMHYEIALSADDSASAGSDRKSIMKVFAFGEDDDSLEGAEHDYHYSFNIPCDPERMTMPGCLEQMRWESAAENQRRFMHQDSESATLADLLGDIPMERVKSYSIKERKNGKRIVIDIDDAPLMENHERVIVIRDRPAKEDKPEKTE